MRAIGLSVVWSVVMGAVACREAAPPESEPTEPVVTVAVEALPTELSEAASATRDAVLEAARSGSQRQLARLAEAHPGFQSNFGGSKHFDYWYMQRRMGSDPNVALEALLAEPFAARRVGGEVWFIWPDLALIGADGPVVADRLTFRERARLAELIGEAGIAAMTRGEGYPGYRMAITQDGRWVYFLSGN